MPTKKPSEIYVFRQKYHSIRKVLLVFGIWPRAKHQLSTYLYCAILLIYVISALFTGILFAEFKSANFVFTHTNNVLTIFAFFYVIIFRREFFFRLMTRITEDVDAPKDNFQGNELKHSGRELYVTIKIGTYFFGWVILLKFLRPLFNLLYLMINPVGTSFQLPPPVALPMIHGPVITYILDSFLGSSLDLSMIFIMSIILLFSLYFCSSCKALKETLAHGKFDDEVDERTFLNNCILWHIRLLGLATDFKEAFNIVLLMHSFISLLDICLVLFSIVLYSDENDQIMSEISFLCGGSTTFLLSCWYSGRVTYASLEVGMGAYESEWFKRSLLEQKKIIVLILRAQKSANFNYFESFGPDLETYLNVTLKNSTNVVIYLQILITIICVYI